MNRFMLEANATLTIAARDVARSLRSRGQLVMFLLFPVLFMGVLGGSLAQNLGAGADFNLLQFILFGMVVTTGYQMTMGTITSLIEDRENDFTQEIFVAPISRYSIIIGKITGGMFSSLVALVGVFLVALVMRITITWADIGAILMMWPIISIAGGALGVLFVSMVKDSRTAQIGQAIIVFPQMFLAGVLIPVNQSSGVLGFLSHIIPLTYLSDLMRNVAAAAHPEYQSMVLYSPILDLTVTVAISAVFIIAGTVLFTRGERTR